MIFILSKLIKNQIKKQTGFIGIRNIFFNFNFLISYSKVKDKKTFIGYIQNGLAIIPNFFYVKSAIRFLVLIIPNSYRFNITKAIEQTCITSYMPIEKVKIINK